MVGIRIRRDESTIALRQAEAPQKTYFIHVNSNAFVAKKTTHQPPMDTYTQRIIAKTHSRFQGSQIRVHLNLERKAKSRIELFPAAD